MLWPPAAALSRAGRASWSASPLPWPCGHRQAAGGPFAQRGNPPHCKPRAPAAASLRDHRASGQPGTAGGARGFWPGPAGFFEFSSYSWYDQGSVYITL